MLYVSSKICAMSTDLCDCIVYIWMWDSVLGERNNISELKYRCRAAITLTSNKTRRMLRIIYLQCTEWTKWIYIYLTFFWHALTFLTVQRKIELRGKIQQTYQEQQRSINKHHFVLRWFMDKCTIHWKRCECASVWNMKALRDFNRLNSVHIKCACTE